MTQFEEVTNKLALVKLYQISIDEPKVNLNLREVEAKHFESFYHSLIDLGPVVCTLNQHNVD